MDETFYTKINEHSPLIVKKRGISDQKINICCAIDGAGRSILQVSNGGRIKAECLIHIFTGKIHPSSDLVSDSQRSYHRLVKELGVTWHKIPSHKKQIDHYTLDKVNHLHSRMKYFLHPFRGISYAFLHGYLAMFRINESYKKAKSLSLTEELMASLMQLKTILTCKMIDEK